MASASRTPRPAEPAVPRWFTAHGEGHAQWYIDRFRRMAAEGQDLAGEARFVDAMVPRHARLLDAGCGPGRISAELHARGHKVVGVDVDPALIAAARTDHPGPTYAVADLATLDLTALGLGGDPFEPFELALIAGNVMVFVAPGSEVDVLRQVAAHVRPDGAVVVGFATDRDYALADFDRGVAAAGLVLEQRFATWDLRPWRDDAAWAVSVLRVPG